MRYLLIALVFLNFVGAAVFGATLNHSMTDHRSCAVSSLTGVPCPTSINEIFSHHIAVLQIFSAPLPLIFSGAAFLLFSLIALSFLLFGAWHFSFSKNKLARPRIKFLDSSSFVFQPELIRWLALHENSPSVLRRR